MVYFAERSSDGTLPVRLMMEGVITREQMQRGTVIVNGVEHVGRMFDADPTIDRSSVELCAELFTEDVMVRVANTMVSSYELHLYRRHSSGIDRWYPHSVPTATKSSESQDAEQATARASNERDAETPPTAKAPARPKPHAETRTASPTGPRNSLTGPPITQAVPVTRPVTATSATTAYDYDCDNTATATDHAGRAGHARSAGHDPGAGHDACPDGADPRDRAGIDGGFGRGRHQRDRRRGCRGDQASVRWYGRRVLAAPLAVPLAAPIGEERTQQRARFFGTQAGSNRRSVVEPRIAAHLVQAVDRAGLRVAGREHHSTDPGVDQGAGAHHTGFQGDVHRAVEQSPVPHDAAQHHESPGSRHEQWGRRSTRVRCAGRRSPRRRARRPRRSAHRRASPPRRPGRAPVASRRRRSAVPSQRRGWDSNPRRVAPHTLSKRADSAALAPLPGKRKGSGDR